MSFFLTNAIVKEMVNQDRMAQYSPILSPEEQFSLHQQYYNAIAFKENYSRTLVYINSPSHIVSDLFKGNFKELKRDFVCPILQETLKASFLPSIIKNNLVNKLEKHLQNQNIKEKETPFHHHESFYA